METRDVFVNDDNFDHREALEAAIDKRKFLLKSLFRNTYALLVTLTLNGCLCLVYKNKIKYDPVWKLFSPNPFLSPSPKSRQTFKKDLPKIDKNMRTL